MSEDATITEQAQSGLKSFIERKTGDAEAQLVEGSPISCETKATDKTKEELEELWIKSGKEKEAMPENMQDRTLEHYISEELPDRDGDIIRGGGFHLDNFTRNPVSLWAHDNHVVPPARSLGVSVVPGTPNRVKAITTFMDDPVYTLPGVLLRAYKTGFMNAWSIGFIPKRLTFVEDEEQRTELGLGRWGCIIEELELLEYSAVPVPACPGAVMNAARAGTLKAGEVYGLKMLAGNTLHNIKDRGSWRWKAAEEFVRNLDELKQSLEREANEKEAAEQAEGLLKRLEKIAASLESTVNSVAEAKASAGVSVASGLKPLDDDMEHAKAEVNAKVSDLYDGIFRLSKAIVKA